MPYTSRSHSTLANFHNYFVYDVSLLIVNDLQTLHLHGKYLFEMASSFNTLELSEQFRNLWYSNCRQHIYIYRPNCRHHQSPFILTGAVHAGPVSHRCDFARTWEAFARGLRRAYILNERVRLLNGDLLIWPTWCKGDVSTYRCSIVYAGVTKSDGTFTDCIYDERIIPLLGNSPYYF